MITFKTCFLFDTFVEQSPLVFPFNSDMKCLILILQTRRCPYFWEILLFFNYMLQLKKSFADLKSPAHILGENTFRLSHHISHIET
ncbi:UNVERIFIED_CONTAM: hypothetical protein GTU68_060687 [Idotea baltica]|nr:hypothetical protein [Idotea baltica]